jgi:hypothetical protein
MLTFLSCEYTGGFCVEYYKVLSNTLDRNGGLADLFLVLPVPRVWMRKLQIHLSETRSIVEAEFPGLEFRCLILDELTSL